MLEPLDGALKDLSVTHLKRDDCDDALLICLDFDLTLTQLHTFHYVIDAIKGGFSREEAVLRAIRLLKSQGPKGGELLWQALAACLNRGHGVAITSFTAFPELAQALLASGLSTVRPLLKERSHSRWLSRPLIIYGDPAPSFNPPQALPNTHLVDQKELSCGDFGKNCHIKAALAALAAKGFSYQKTLLMDDDPHNIKLATEAGHLVISVNREEGDLTHIDRLLSQI